MTNLTDALHIPDTQSARDDRHLLIQRVGVKDVRYPLTIVVAGVAQAALRGYRDRAPALSNARSCSAI